MSIRDLLIGLLIGGAISLGIYAIHRARIGGSFPNYKVVGFENIEEWEIVEDEEGNLKKIIVHRSVRPAGKAESVRYRDVGEVREQERTGTSQN